MMATVEDLISPSVPPWPSADHVSIQKCHVVRTVLSQQHKIFRTIIGFTTNYLSPKGRNKVNPSKMTWKDSLYKFVLSVYNAPGPEPTDGDPNYLDKVCVFMGLTL